MKSKLYLASLIFQIVAGVAAIAAFVILAVSGEPMLKWVPALIAAIAYLVGGMIGIAGFVKKD